MHGRQSVEQNSGRSADRESIADVLCLQMDNWSTITDIDNDNYLLRDILDILLSIHVKMSVRWK